VAAPVAGVCNPWITGADLPANCCADLVQRSTAAVVACNILFRLSGRQFPGICQRTIRPCGVGCGAWSRWPAYRDTWWPAYLAPNGGWIASGPSVAGGGCCGRCKLPSVTLPGPVDPASVEVVIDGVALNPLYYRVVGYRRLERLDGGVWPCTQDLTADSGIGGDPGTFQVTYSYGRNPGPDGIVAAVEYACEFAKHLCGASDCKLPARTRSVTRQGVTFDVTSSLDFLDRGRTGIAAVDLWLASVNPTRLPRRATIRRFDTDAGGGAPTGLPAVGFYTVAGYADQVNHDEILALIAAHPDLVKVTYETTAVSAVPVNGWYLHNGTLANFTGRTWPVIWEGTAAQIPAQGSGDAQFQTGDLAITRTSTL
jgi:hypothetical protein